MDVIKVGRGNGNDIIINDATVSSNHLIIEVVDHERLILNDISTNGTFINGLRILKSEVTAEDKIVLGNFELDNDIFFANVKKLYYKDKKDFSKEFESLLQVFAQYQNKKDLLLKTPVLPIILRMGSGAILILILIFFPSIIPENLRYPIMTAIGLLSVASSLIGNNVIEKNKKLDILRLEYEDKLVCPKCNYKMINNNITYWKGKRKCLNEKCDAIFQK